MKTLVQFGAGNIGRSFIGQLFSRAGYEVVFVDIDDKLIEALNREHCYKVIHKSPEVPDEIIEISNIRAIHGADSEKLTPAIAEADILATSVGSRALPAILPAIAEGLKARLADDGGPIDIILAENLRDADEFVRRELSTHLPAEFPLDQVGLVESSIGKMVPIMKPEDLAVDPLQVFAEPYNTLIIDGTAFRGERPDISEISYQTHMRAYVDRKLFLHNLGHAATAYLGFQISPELTRIAEVVTISEVYEAAQAAMKQASRALEMEYPGVFEPEDLPAHIDDLLRRFANPVLGDTVFRVGRDLGRKLAGDDRVIGALRLTARHSLPNDAIIRVYLAALKFTPPEAEESDRHLTELASRQGIEKSLQTVSGLDMEDSIDRQVIESIRAAIL